MVGLIHIATPGSGRKSVDFDSPLAMLKECHRRVESQCRTLVRLVPHLAQHGSDKAAAEAAVAVMRYFDLAAPLHHEDEESDLFPALMESMAGSDAVCLRGLTDGLRTDHAELDGRWQALRKVLQAVAQGRPAALDAAEVEAFDAMYVRHIACEEGELFPMAERLLSDEAMARIGQSMRARRTDPVKAPS